jgi:hypothetical protein
MASQGESKIPDFDTHQTGNSLFLNHFAQGVFWHVKGSVRRKQAASLFPFDLNARSSFAQGVGTRSNSSHPKRESRRATVGKRFLKVSF